MQKRSSDLHTWKYDLQKLNIDLHKWNVELHRWKRFEFVETQVAKAIDNPVPNYRTSCIHAKIIGRSIDSVWLCVEKKFTEINNSAIENKLPQCQDLRR